MTDAIPINPHVREIGRPGQRVIGVGEFGDPDGTPVLAFHGIPGTRLMFRAAHSVGHQLGLHLIAPDRPGFGRSTPQPKRQLQDWIPEIEAVLAAYGIDRFSLIGVSGGSPFATATAAHFGDRVVAMTLIGPMGPVAETHREAALTWLNRAFFLQLPKVPGGMRATLTPANALFRLSPKLQYELFLRMLPPSDRKIMRHHELRAQVIEDVHESLKQGGEGMRTDLAIFSRPWNVDYQAISAKTFLWQGLADTIVPVDVALSLGAFIPNCVVHRIPDGGHFWIYDNVSLVLNELADAIKSSHLDE